MIVIAGTCHVFNLRGKIKSLVRSHRPQAVCVELDEKRLEKLKSRPLYPTGLLSLVQKLIAMRYGTEPGNDMLGAVEGADETGTPLFLIDRDIDITVKKLQEALIKEFLSPFEVIRKLIVSMGTDVSWRQLPVLSGRDVIEYFIYDFAENPDKYRNQFELLFPFFKRVLLDEREEHMAGEIRRLSGKYEDIFVVVGAGHVTGLERLLPDLETRSSYYVASNSNAA